MLLYPDEDRAQLGLSPVEKSMIEEKGRQREEKEDKQKREKLKKEKEKQEKVRELQSILINKLKYDSAIEENRQRIKTRSKRVVISH